MHDSTPSPDHQPGQPPERPNRGAGFFAELKRRKVYRVGAAYLAVALAALEGASMVFPTLGLGPGAFNALVLISLLGFPLALALAWTFDVTGSGIRRTEPLAPGTSAPLAPDRWVRLKAALVGAGFVAVVWVGVRAWQPLGAPSDDALQLEEARLAVLPPAVFSPEGDYTYLADGLHEEILQHLALLPGIHLASRTSSSFMRDAEPMEAANALGVRYVMESSIRLVQDSLVLTAQLIDTSVDDHIWSEKIGRRFTLEGVYELQEVLAQRVAAALSGTLSSETSVDLGTLPTRSLDAYNEYLRGIYRQNQFHIEAMWAAVDHYERAIQLDPEFARAHARLAVLLAMLNNYGHVTQGEAFPRIREHAALAVEHGAPDDPVILYARMSYLWPVEWDWEGARSVLEEALSLAPDYVDAMWALAEWHGVIAGNTERGLEIVDEASRLDPFSPVLPTVRWWILYNNRRFEEGIPILQALLAANPDNENVAKNLATSLGLTGRQEEGRQLLNEWIPRIPAARRGGTLAAHLARVGDTVAAREVLSAAIARKEAGGSVPASGIASGYAVLGEVEPALDWLERAFAEEGGIYYLRTPDWENLAGHPRFQALWDRVGLGGVYPTLR